jgi:hypothetical protein
MFLTTFFLRWSLFVTAMAMNNIVWDGDSPQNTNSIPSVKWIVEKTSTLRVEGESNLNKFKCDIEGYYQRDTIVCFDNGQVNKPVQLRGSLKIDIFKFDCHNKLITSDLRKTLKAEEHPKLVIRFLSLERVPVFNGNTDIIKGLVSVQLAGTSKTFEILYSFIKPGSSTIILNGGSTFMFSDFNLKPPSKVGGFIKIKNEFDVNFRLILNPVV